MNLQSIAIEMKAVAEQNPLSKDLLIASLGKLKFPENLKRIENVEPYGQVHIQFSIDSLSNKIALFHLSFSKENCEKPSEQMIADFKYAFFEDMLGVITLPPINNHDFVIQMLMKI